MNNSTSTQQQQRLRRQQLLAQLQQQKANYVSNYDLPLNYPANVVASASNTTDNSSNESSKKTVRTSTEFINARLIESGLSFDSATSSNNDNASTSNNNKSTLANHSMSINRFINNLEGTGCYDAIQVHLSPSSSSDNGITNDITVQLKEKNWYKLYIGGGVNSDDLSSFSNASSSTTAGNVIQLPKVQFETSASLLNLTGYTDVTSASYIVDQTGSTSFKLIHDRPLISYLNSRDSVVRRWLMPAHPNDAVDTTNQQNENENELDEINKIDNQLAIGGGTQTSLGIHATFHDVDYESTRSYKEYIRCLGLRLANHARGAGNGSYKPSTSTPESMAGPYTYLDWNIALKDILPKRSSNHPYILDCSSEIANQSGTYLKHSLEGGLYMNGCLCDDRYDPTFGYDYYLKGEVAGPPGDVGFVKLHCGYNWHLPVELIRLMMFGVDNNDGYIEEKSSDDESPFVAGMTLHSSFNFGILRPLTFNGLLGSGSGGGNNRSSSTTFVPSSDRFYIGGPGQLRCFLPAGIGPRSSEGGSSVPGGDALGGDLFYTSMLSTSIPFPTYFATLRNNGGRLFGFVNAGTCVAVGDQLSMSSTTLCNRILQSSRVSVGGGVSAGLPMGRFEATYAVPIRYGPRDARKAVQFGFGFSFG